MDKKKKIRITVIAALAVLILIAVLCVTAKGINGINGEEDATPADAGVQSVQNDEPVSEEVADDTVSDENSLQHTHEYVPATCSEPKTCEVCGGTAGEALGHNFYKGVCVRCGAENPDYTAPVMEADEDDDNNGSASAEAEQSGSNTGAGQTASSGSSNSGHSSAGTSATEATTQSPSTTQTPTTEAAAQTPATEAPATECQHVWEPYVELQTVKTVIPHYACTGCGKYCDTRDEMSAHEEARRAGELDHPSPISWTATTETVEKDEYVQTGEKCKLCGEIKKY